MNKALLAVIVLGNFGFFSSLNGIWHNDMELTSFGLLNLGFLVGIVLLFPLKVKDAVKKDRTSKLPITSGEKS